MVGGHVTDASDYITYSSTVQTLSVRLLMVISSHNNLSLMAGDVGNAFLTAPATEKYAQKQDLSSRTEKERQ